MFSPLFSYKHQSYCWQVGLHQSLLPLQTDGGILSIHTTKVTNYFSVHYLNEYYFETQEFGISDKGIHLLRSRFNYETIEFNQIDQLVIEKGKELKNWSIILTIGLGLLSFSAYYSFRLFEIIFNNEVPVIYIEEILVPLIPFMLGAYCFYSSTRNGTVLKIKTIKNKHDKFPLKRIEKEDKLSLFHTFLKEKLNTKVKINM